MKPSVLIAALVLAGACRPAGEEGMSREAFVATYIDLRSATVAGELDAGTRDSILEAHGTTEAELRAYLDQRADDPEAIADTWREVMDSVAAAADTVAAEADTIPAETDSLPPEE